MKHGQKGDPGEGKAKIDAKTILEDIAGRRVLRPQTNAMRTLQREQLAPPPGFELGGGYRECVSVVKQPVNSSPLRSDAQICFDV